MIYVLIDNCILRHFVDTNGYSNYILELENLIENQHIRLVTHPLIIEEWQKHKTKWIKDKERKLNRLNPNSSANLPEPFINYQHIELQFQQIDLLLEKSYIQLSTPSSITSEYAYRQRNSLAPFHKKKDSLNDWEIIGSMGTYCEIYNIKEFTFISSNYTDFADENETDTTIHQTIQERFPKVKIHYFRDFTAFFKAIDTFSNFPIHLIPYQLNSSPKFSFDANRKSNILNSICALYGDLYEEINFIPIHILKKRYPFVNSKEKQAYYKNFNLYYVNEEVVSFFDNIILEKENTIKFKNTTPIEYIKDYEDKTKKILSQLTNNLVFSFSGEESRQRISTYYSKSSFCNCYKCAYNRYEFYSVFKNLKENISNNYKDRLKQAYYHYSLGNFLSAYFIYEEIIQSALNDKKFISYFIAKYNQKHLAIFLNNPFKNKEIDREIIDTLSNIDPIEEAVKLKSHTDYNLLLFIAQEDFFTDAFQNIKNEVNEILHHYYIQLNGGWSSKKDVWDLIEEYAKLDNFLHHNYIIYDRFSNYDKLFDMVTEGLFAAHAIQESQRRLLEFDDYWISKFIAYGSKKSMLEYFNRFNLKSLKYKSTSNEGEKESFIDVAKNLLEKEKQIFESFEENADKTNNSFRENYFRYVENIIILASLLDIEQSTLDEFAFLLLEFLKKQNSLYSYSLICVREFINYKGKKINGKILNDFLTLYLEKTEHNDITLDYILLNFDDSNITNVSTDNIKVLFSKITLCQKCKEYHNLEAILCFVYHLKDKTYISKHISQLLELQFDFELFYKSTLYDIIPLNEDRLMQIIKELELSPRTNKQQSHFMDTKYYHVNMLDEILNLCFKSDIDTTQKYFFKFKKVAPYYEWLIDLDGFNYDNFNSEWVLDYNTYYYQKIMSKSEKLKSNLIKHLIINQNERIAKALLNITYFKNER